MYALNASVNSSCTYTKHMCEVSYESYSIDSLSAYLFEETKEPVYQQAAQLSVDFSLSHLWNGTVFERTFDPSTCTTRDQGPASTLNQWLLEGREKSVLSKCL